MNKRLDSTLVVLPILNVWRPTLLLHRPGRGDSASQPPGPPPHRGCKAWIHHSCGPQDSVGDAEASWQRQQRHCYYRVCHHQRGPAGCTWGPSAQELMTLLGLILLILCAVPFHCQFTMACRALHPACTPSAQTHNNQVTLSSLRLAGLGLCPAQQALEGQRHDKNCKLVQALRKAPCIVKIGLAVAPEWMPPYGWASS